MLVGTIAGKIIEVIFILLIFIGLGWILCAAFPYILNSIQKARIAWHTFKKLN